MNPAEVCRRVTTYLERSTCTGSSLVRDNHCVGTLSTFVHRIHLFCNINAPASSSRVRALVNFLQGGRYQRSVVLYCINGAKCHYSALRVLQVIVRLLCVSVVFAAVMPALEQLCLREYRTLPA